jgi:hypothetical protein
MPWDVFVKQSRTRSTSPMITIGKKLGRVALNRAAAGLFERENVDFVLFMFDKAVYKMGLKPASKKDARAFAVRLVHSKDKDKGVAGGALSGVTFLQHIGYDLSTSQQYPIKWDSDENIFEVQLPEERFRAQQKPLTAVEGGKRHAKAGD